MSRGRGDLVRLKELRKKKGISQLRLATDLNTTQNTISRYETGEREPGIGELIKIADRLNRCKESKIMLDLELSNEEFKLKYIHRRRKINPFKHR